MAAFVRAGKTSPNIGSKYLSSVQSQTAVTGGRNSKATPAQSPVVACYVRTDHSLRHSLKDQQFNFAETGKLKTE